MAKHDTQPRFEMFCDQIETTDDWMFDPSAPGPSPWRTFKPGPNRYRVDGVEVSEEEFSSRWEQESGRKTFP